MAANNEFSQQIEEIIDLQKQAKLLAVAKDEKTAKVEQLKTELATLQDRGDELEGTINNASALLMDGHLSDEDYCNHKNELGEIYRAIDNKQSLLALYEKALDVDYGKNYTEISRKIESKRARLVGQYGQKIACDIVEKSGQELKQLLAILPNDLLSVSAAKEHKLGSVLINALTYEPDGSRKQKGDPDENKKLYQAVLLELGI